MNQRSLGRRDADDVHPDQGTIHAWLEGALDTSAATRTEAHAAECALCSARIAEARGLIAGASRVAGLLDDVPPPIIFPTPTGPQSAWRALRVTPARAALTAGLVVALGVVLTRRYGAIERIPAPSATASPSSCMRVEGSPGSEARWESVSLPFVLAYDSTGMRARILTPDGKDTRASAVVTAASADSLTLRLEHATHTVYMSLTGGGPVRPGVITRGGSTAQHDSPVKAHAVSCPGH